MGPYGVGSNKNYNENEPLYNYHNVLCSADFPCVVFVLVER